MPVFRSAVTVICSYSTAATAYGGWASDSRCCTSMIAVPEPACSFSSTSRTSRLRKWTQASSCSSQVGLASSSPARCPASAITSATALPGGHPRVSTVASMRRARSFRSFLSTVSRTASIAESTSVRRSVTSVTPAAESASRARAKAGATALSASRSEAAGGHPSSRAVLTRSTALRASSTMCRRASPAEAGSSMAVGPACDCRALSVSGISSSFCPVCADAFSGASPRVCRRTGTTAGSRLSSPPGPSFGVGGSPRSGVASMTRCTASATAALVASSASAPHQSWPEAHSSRRASNADA